MAADAIALFTRMRARELLGVAGKAFRPEELDWFYGLIVWIMAGSAPHLTMTLSGASTSGELLHMADDLELLGAGTVLRDVDVSGKNILQALPRPKIAERFSWIKHSANTQQVTLFADAVAGSRLQLRRIDDRACSRIIEVPFSRAVTTLTCDCFRREWRRAILV